MFSAKQDFKEVSIISAVCGRKMAKLRIELKQTTLEKRIQDTLDTSVSLRNNIHSQGGSWIYKNGSFDTFKDLAPSPEMATLAPSSPCLSPRPDLTMSTHRAKDSSVLSSGPMRQSWGSLSPHNIFQKL